MASTQVFGLMLNAGFHIISAYYVGRAYYYFRKNGGIHGLAKTDTLPEEKLLQKAGELAGKGAVLAEAAVDKQINKEKTDDAEADSVAKAIKESAAIN